MRRLEAERRGLLAGVGIAALALLGLGLAMARAAEPTNEVDTALIVAVDVSNSVDDARYKLQMEGIAQALTLSPGHLPLFGYNVPPVHAALRVDDRLFCISTL